MGETVKTTAKLLPAGKSGIRRFLNADRVAVLAVVVAYAVVAILVYTGSATRQLMNMLISVSCYIVLALSLNLVVGLLGELSLGHAGFMSVGLFSGCTVAVLLHDTLPVIICLPLSMIVGGLAAALVGFLVGLPALRLRGDYLAIVTLACGEIIKNVITNLDVDGTPLRGALGIDTSSIRMSPTELLPYAIVLVLVTMLVIMNFKRSKHGRAIMAIRDNRIAAEATGVNVTYYKLMVFVLASLFAGMAGVLYGYSLPTTEASLFDYNMSIEILVIVVLGGMGNLGGSIIAAIILRVLPEALRDFSDYRMLAYSILLIGIMLLRSMKDSRTTKRTEDSRMKKRSVVSVVILSIITCGIYTVVMAYRIINEMEHEGAKLSVPSMEVLLFMIFIHPVGGGMLGYVGNNALNQVRKQWGLSEQDNKGLWIVVGVFVPFVALALIQNSINHTLEQGTGQALCEKMASADTSAEGSEQADSPKGGDGQ